MTSGTRSIDELTQKLEILEDRIRRSSQELSLLLEKDRTAGTGSAARTMAGEYQILEDSAKRYLTILKEVAKERESLRAGAKNQPETPVGIQKTKRSRETQDVEITQKAVSDAERGAANANRVKEARQRAAQATKEAHEVLDNFLKNANSGKAKTTTPDDDSISEQRVKEAQEKLKNEKRAADLEEEAARERARGESAKERTGEKPGEEPGGHRTPFSSSDSEVKGGASEKPSDAPPDVESQFAQEKMRKINDFYQKAGKYAEALRQIVEVPGNLEHFQNLRDIELLDTDIEKTKRLAVTTEKGVRGILPYLLTEDYGTFRDTGKNIQKINDLYNKYLQRAFDEARARGYTLPDDYLGGTSTYGGAYTLLNFKGKNTKGVEERASIPVNVAGEVDQSAYRIPAKYASLTQTLAKDVQSLALWSAAIAIIYAPINALTQAMRDLLAVQTALADVSVAITSDYMSLNAVFSDVYKAAQQSGEELIGVIDAYGQAYRAAGRIRNEYQRAGTTETLLRDSLLLSKISSLSQTEAIDTLSAALYQTKKPGESPAESLSRGTELIDKWVRVSQVANVDVATLATGVAVLGDSAETAGLDIEHLNALVAVLAETSVASGKETANMAKTLIGNFQQPQSATELSRLGISIKDVSGKIRDFLGVMEDVYALRTQGILSDQDFQRLTLALGGGGTRRQKDVAAFLENFSRMQEVVDLQAGSSGAASEAMAKKMDTVSTSVTQLQNSLVGLVSALGNDGGLLDMFTVLAKGGTAFVDVLSKISSAAGKTSTILIAALAGQAMLKAKQTDLYSFLIAQNPKWGEYVSSQERKWSQGGLAFLSGRATLNPFDFGAPVVRPPSSAGLGAQAGYVANRMMTSLGVASIALPAIGNFVDKKPLEGAFNIVGGIAGGLITMGNPIGMAIGSAIGEAFVKTTLTYEKSLGDFFVKSVQKTADEKSKEKETPEILTEEAYKAMGGGSPWLGSAINAIFTASMTLYKGIGREILSPEQMRMNMLSRLDPELKRKIEAQFISEGKRPEGTFSEIDTRQKEIISDPLTKGFLNYIMRERVDELQTDLIRGEIKPSDYNARLKFLSAFPESASQKAAAIEKIPGGLGPGFESREAQFAALLNILSSGNSELIDELNANITSIDQLNEILKGWVDDTQTRTIKNPVSGETEELTKSQTQEILDFLLQLLKGTVVEGNKQVVLENIKKDMPEMYGPMTAPSFRTVADLTLAVEQTKKKQEKVYKEGMGLSESEYNTLISSFDAFSVAVGDFGKAGDYFYQKIKEGLDPKIFAEVVRQLQESGEIKPEKGLSNFTTVDVTSDVMRRVAEQSVVLGTAMSKNKALNYQPNFEDVIIGTNDEQINAYHADMKIVQYLLQDILDANRKQLDGIYNLPADATFMVPLAAASMHAATKGASVGGLEELLKNPTLPDDSSIPEEKPVENEVIGVIAPSEDIIPSLSVHRKDPANTVPTPSTQVHRKDEIGGFVPHESTKSTFFEAIAQALQSLLPLIFAPQAPWIKVPEIQSESSSAEKTGILEGLAKGLASSMIAGLFPALDLTGKKPLFDTALKTPESGGLKAGVTQFNTAPATRLDLKIESSSQLIVDGRVLAEVIKPFLTTDLLATEDSIGTVTKRFVI